MGGFSDKFELTREIHSGGTAGAIFVARVMEQGLTHLRTGSWATSERSLDAIADVLHPSPGRELGTSLRSATGR